MPRPSHGFKFCARKVHGFSMDASGFLFVCEFSIEGRKNKKSNVIRSFQVDLLGCRYLRHSICHSTIRQMDNHI